ncbi:MAG TPA: cupin domain-containing protein [Methyloceanibacter sp.]|nr:cupin domain-containing protein [Methyloceanibacter sp.]
MPTPPPNRDSAGLSSQPPPGLRSRQHQHGGTANESCIDIGGQAKAGGRLGWHTDATEETQYIIAGTGKLYLEDGSTLPVGPGSVFVLPTPMRHDLENTGKETLRAVAFFAAAMFTQDFDQ